MSVFGFSTETAESGDFLPIIKYDARSGRWFRVDRTETVNGFVGEPVDITNIFKVIADFENVEVGWINFVAGSAPDFRLVPIGSRLPPRPSDVHKNGIRFMVKLSTECAAGQPPLREVAGTSKAFLSGLQAVYLQYKAEASKNPGKLPVIIMEKSTPVKSGTGERQSTNYHPTFRIVAWVPRGDLEFSPKAGATGFENETAPTTQPMAPSTGSTRVAPPPPQAKTAVPDVMADFG
jgi:hypothetical protein